MVVDGVAGRPFRSIAPDSLMFSGDGRHVAYAARDDQSVCVVLDGQINAGWEDIGDLVFSGGESRFAFAAKARGRWVAVVDGKRSPECDGISSLTFSPDGRRLAWVAVRDRRMMPVVDGREGRWHEEGAVVLPVVFSPDNRHFAYRVHAGGGQSVVLHGTVDSCDTRLSIAESVCSGRAADWSSGDQGGRHARGGHDGCPPVRVTLRSGSNSTHASPAAVTQANPLSTLNAITRLAP